MSAGFDVIKAGVHTTLQDFGRIGLRAIGVPGSGALDPDALRLVNLLVQNPPGTGALEMLYSGSTLMLTGGDARIAIGGAEAVIETPQRSTRVLPAWHSTLMRAGEKLRVGVISGTTAAYLAVDGGFDIPPTLGSVATSVRAGLGGYNGRILRARDRLPLNLSVPARRAERCYVEPPVLQSPAIVRVCLGPHADTFLPDSIKLFLASTHTVSQSSDRIGLRLDGAVLRHRTSYDLLSEGIPPGSIQVPGSGQPILLLADHPTVGGYPRIATVISADVPAAGRLRIGGAFKFAAVDDAEARRARQERKQWLDGVVAGIKETR